jgi:DNA repair protein RadD
MIQLRPNQIEAADAVENAFRSGVKRPLVDSCVGSGKSLIFAELARREIERGGRALIIADRRELVEQNAKACRSLGLKTGVNASKLNERCWRAPVISAQIQSIFRSPQSFGPVTLLLTDEAHTWPHSEGGMYRQLARGLQHSRMAGASGTVFRLQGGSLAEGEGAPFEKVVYRYSIIDGIRDGYLVPAFSAPATDKIDPSKLKSRSGDYTGESQDGQMIAAMDNHIAQMIQYKDTRRKWLIFEASVKAVLAMTDRLNQWGIRSCCVHGEMNPGERDRNIKAYARGQYQALVNKDICTTGFDDPEIDLLCMRFKTKSLGKYIQIIGRLLRTIGGHIDASIRAGKADGLVFDFGGNIDDHGPLDFIRQKETKLTHVSCDECGKRNASAAARCWACEAPMTKLCPACLCPVVKGTLDCPECGHDMRTGGAGEARAPQKLLDTPSGAALIASYKTGAERSGGWLPIRKAWEKDGKSCIVTVNGDICELPEALAAFGADARWVRLEESGALVGVLVPNGASRNSIRQYAADGTMLLVPMPSLRDAA